MMHGKKAAAGNLYREAVGKKIDTKKLSLRVRNHMINTIKIQLPKSQLQRSPTLQGKDDDKLVENFMSIYYCVLEDCKENEQRQKDTEAVLDALIAWRNEVYTRLDSKFPSKQALRDKYLRVSDAAIKLHIAYFAAFGVMQPYIHHLLHCEDWLAYDLVERTAEALEHLNKIMKAKVKLTSRRKTPKLPPLPLVGAALSTPSPNKRRRGIHKAGSGTIKTAFTLSTTEKHISRIYKQKMNPRQRRVAKETVKANLLVKQEVERPKPPKKRGRK